MPTPKPAWVTGDYGTSYDQLVKSWGHEVIDQDEFGSYQGDLIYLLREGDRHGLLVLGYGSCSGCDELQSVEPWDDEGDWTDVVLLAVRLAGEVHWEPTKGALMDWVNSYPENHWWSYDHSIRKWLNDRGAALPLDSDYASED